MMSGFIQAEVQTYCKLEDDVIALIHGVDVQHKIGIVTVDTMVIMPA
jgi:hypothetical protein